MIVLIISGNLEAVSDIFVSIHPILSPVVSVMPFGEESVYDVLWAHTVVIERSALEASSSSLVSESEEKDVELDSSNEEGDNA